MFASDLEEFVLGDIEAGLSSIGKRERQIGETAFPSIGTMFGAIREARRARVAKENAETARLEGLRDERRREENKDWIAEMRETEQKLADAKVMQ